MGFGDRARMGPEAVCLASAGRDPRSLWMLNSKVLQEGQDMGHLLSEVFRIPLAPSTTTTSTEEFGTLSCHGLGCRYYSLQAMASFELKNLKAATAQEMLKKRKEDAENLRKEKDGRDVRKRGSA